MISRVYLSADQSIPGLFVFKIFDSSDYDYFYYCHFTSEINCYNLNSELQKYFGNNKTFEFRGVHSDILSFDAIRDWSKRNKDWISCLSPEGFEQICSYESHETLISKLIKLRQFGKSESGITYFIPTMGMGGLSSNDLIEIAKYLEEENKPFFKHIDDYFESDVSELELD